MWISRKIAAITSTNTAAENNKPSVFTDRLNKPLPPIIGSKCIRKADRMIIAVSGAANVGKSTLIRLGLENLVAKHDSNRPDLQCHQVHIIMNQASYPADIFEFDSLSALNEQLPVIHGGLVCYDTTDRDSLDCIPDLLNFYLNRDIPTFLVGLKSDLSRQVDSNLVERLVDLFSLKHFNVDAFSEAGVKQMQDLFKQLLKRNFSIVCDETKTRPSTYQQQQQQVETSAGFIYAPTAVRKDELTIVEQFSATSSGSEADPDKDLIENNHIASTFFSSRHMVNQRGINTTIPSHFTHLGSRRGSKDSSESFGIGLTAEDIIDRLLSTEYNKADENIIPIFLTFFRKFMKPCDLVNMLVQRFENNGLSSDNLPTDLQKRIHSIFSLWLSHYWNDFYGAHARKHIILFLDRISKYESLTPICDSLAPLVVREPPSEDPDKIWGFVDDEEEQVDEPLSPPPTPFCQTKRRNEKKDSAYASGTFSMTGFIQEYQPASSSPLSSPTKNEPFLLKRLSGNSNHSMSLPRQNPPRLPHIISTNNDTDSTIPTPLLSPNMNRLLFRRQSGRKAMTHSESQPDLRSSYATGNKNILSPANNDVDELPRRAEFAGGLINIDNVSKSKNRCMPPSITLSVATTNGGRWSSSLGHHLLASSFVSSFRVHKSDKDQTTHDYKMFIKYSDKTIADQLTWIEAELFSRIKPREFIRNIWATSSSSSSSSSSSMVADGFSNNNSNNTVLASIAHFNFISAWVATTIVTQSKLSKRVALLEKFMSIAVELRNHNNYNSLMAILAGVNSASILRLKQTRHAVATKNVYKQFQSLERIMSTDRSFSSYRMALKASGTPGIPYLGIHNQDLVSLAEANKDFRADGTIHWEKFRLMGETIMATMKFKYPGYSIEPDSKLLTLIADSSILSEDEQYKRSILIEPRLTSSSTNRVRDLWLRLQ